MSEIVVRDKRLTVRTSFKGKEWYSLPGDYRRALEAYQRGDYSEAIAFLSRVIESWEFAGEPSEAASYEKLDVLSELRPLLLGVLGTVAEAAFPKVESGT